LRHRSFPRAAAVAGLAILSLTGLAACGDDTPSSSTATTAGATTVAPTKPVTVRLGYFPNVTHGTALVAVNKGIYTKDLPKRATLETKTFTVGTAAMEALFADAVDITYVGPSPTINAYEKSKGEALKIVSGATSGGASLVVKPTITSAADLKGKKIASPGLGGTQDVALRAWLKTQNLKTDVAGGGDVSIAPQDNAQTLDAFKAGSIDGGWVPEPWATRLVQEGGGKVLLDEKTLWPQGRWVTTHIVVSQKFLKENPDVVEAVVKAELEAEQLIKDDPAAAQAAIGAEIEKITTKKVGEASLTASLKNLEFTSDPVTSSLKKQYDDAKGLNLLKDATTPLDGIYDLSILNKLLKAAGKPEVSAA
jgi:NitT/TauT family transport system substrate-binding protein